jgi:adenylate cyclase
VVTIYGDGVNVAARLQVLAAPGGICVSRTVHNHVKNKLDLDFVAMGEHKVKNIAEPIEVWRVDLGAARVKRALRGPAARRLGPAIAAAVVLVLATGVAGAWYALWRPAPEPSLPAVAETGAKPALPLPGKPSIAVLPFENLSGDPQRERLADGITEDIITDLSRFRELFVIARNSTFVYKDKPIDVRQIARELGVQYVLEGSLQTEDEQVRITAQLIDATTGNHVWSERYDRPLDDVFTIQDDVTHTIAASLAGVETLLPPHDEVGGLSAEGRHREHRGENDGPECTLCRLPTELSGAPPVSPRFRCLATLAKPIWRGRRSVGFWEGRLGVRYCPPGHLTAVSAAEGEAAEIAGKQT